MVFVFPRPRHGSADISGGGTANASERAPLYSPTQPFPVGADKIGPNCMPDHLIPAGFKGMCMYEPADYDCQGM